MEGSSIRSELATGVFVCSAQAFLRLGLATTVLTGGALLLAGELSFLYFLGFLFAAARLYDPLGVVLQNIAATFNTKLQIERMRSILEQPVQTGTENFHPDRYDITFDHVSFAYREGAGVLEDVSFTARQGEVTALIGPSGGGKSTACKLAARFWDVTGGKVSLGGTDVSTVDPETLLRSYSMVFQDVVLFRDTVMENIRLGRRGATDEEVLEAARAAQCDEFIRKLPQGYQTVIGENGSTLSGGERQRISIARALLKDAPVVLLDEATASLDVENESAVQTALSRLLQGKTVLVIAHRMRTVAGARPHRGAGGRPCGPAGRPGGAAGTGRASTAVWWSSRGRAPSGGWVHDPPLFQSMCPVFREYNILWRSRHYGDALPEGAVLPLFLWKLPNGLEKTGAWEGKNERRQPAGGQETGAALLYFSGVRSVIPSVIADFHVLGGVLENLGKGLVRLFLHHAGNLAVGFLQNFSRLALADLLIVLIEELLPAVHHRVHIPFVKQQGVPEVGVGQRGNEPAVPVHAVRGDGFRCAAEVFGGTLSRWRIPGSTP